MAQAQKDEAPPNPRWSRTQRFTLSAYGRTVTAAYRSTIAATREPTGRGAFEAACAAWAELFELQPEDGMYLNEVSAKSLTLAELGDALAICSQSRDDVTRCVQRLFRAGLITLVPRG
jgi:hypothetical protein